MTPSTPVNSLPSREGAPARRTIADARLDSHHHGPRQTASLDVLIWAIRRQESVVVSVNRAGRWTLLRSRLMAGNENDPIFRLDAPQATPKGDVLHLAAGETIGVSFRHGHKKCVFATTVVGFEHGEDGDSAILLRWPEHLDEIQRRAYQRAMVPPERKIPVLIKTDSSLAPVCCGCLSDLSAGGVGIELPASEIPRLEMDRTFRIEILADKPEKVILVEATLRHTTALSAGRVRLGLQFVGLEYTVAKRRTLSALITMAERFQRPARRRRRRRRNSPTCSNTPI
jgi:c-di-GMP-binding flagellar brake protein YcgR